MSKLHSMEEHCHYGHEVKYDCDRSDFNPYCRYIVCLFFHDEGLKFNIRYFVLEISPRKCNI